MTGDSVGLGVCCGLCYLAIEGALGEHVRGGVLEMMGWAFFGAVAMFRTAGVGARVIRSLSGGG